MRRAEGGEQTPKGRSRGANAGAQDNGGRDQGAKKSSEGGFGQRGQSRAGQQRDDPLAHAYAVLGLDVGTGKAEIERAYRSKMKRAHPDHGGAVEWAAAINQARDVLLARR